MYLSRIVTAGSAVLALVTSAAANETAKQGISATEVTFAQVAALDGPAAALGTGMRDGIMAAFEEANRNGGVHGRMLRLESMDDGYEPDRSVTHVRNVISLRQPYRLHRPGRHADVQGNSTDCHRSRHALHRSLHRRRLPARCQPRQTSSMSAPPTRQRRKPGSSTSSIPMA